MFAIFEQGGKQYKVSQGDIIRIEKVEAKAGDTLTFKQVLLVAHSDDKVEVGQPFVSTAVEVKVLSQGKGDKVRIVKHKAKKRYNRTQGHRQCYTEIEIMSIGAAKAEKKAVVKEEKAELNKEEKAAPAKKPAAKKAPAKKEA